MSQEIVSYSISGGDIHVWLDGPICLKAVASQYRDPVDIGDDEAFELAERLLTLVRIRTSRNPIEAKPEHLNVWYDGCVCIKAVTPENGHVEISDESATELAERLLMLARTQGRNDIIER
jgi:hypothetical protein